MNKVRKVVRYGLEMRESYDFSKMKLTSWYPRHMNKGLLQLQAKLHSVDCVIEVHDSRIPFSGRNDNLTDLGIVRPSVLVMNKVDLIDEKHIDDIRNKLIEEQGQDILFNNCKHYGHEGVKKLLPKIIQKIETSDRYGRSSRKEYMLMVIGIPNVGKSSLINSMRNYHLKSKKATQVGANPGVTKSVLTKIQIHSKPSIFVLDTPGVLSPRIDNPGVALKLGLAATIQQNIIPRDFMADYLLFHLNKYGRHEYVDVLQLPSPTDDVRELIYRVALRYNLMDEIRVNNELIRRPSWTYASDKFLSLWRKKEFGCCLLDKQKLDYYSKRNATEVNK